MRDLDEVRRQVRAQFARRQDIDRRASLALEHPQEHVGLSIRCSKSHARGKVPKIGEVHRTQYGTFFSSTIPWARSDAVKLRPWLEEVHLTNLFGDRPKEMADDQMLRSALETLDWWRERGPGDKSWIADRGGRATKILEILDLPYTEGRLSLWVRCPAHLDDFEDLSPTSLVASLRSAD
jgi:hypothetical protein